MVFSMPNIPRRQNEAMEEKKIKERLLWKEDQKWNLVPHNSVSIIMPRQEFFIALTKAHCRANLGEISHCIYSG